MKKEISMKRDQLKWKRTIGLVMGFCLSGILLSGCSALEEVLQKEAENLLMNETVSFAGEEEPQTPEGISGDRSITETEDEGKDKKDKDSGPEQQEGTSAAQYYGSEPAVNTEIRNQLGIYMNENPEQMEALWAAIGEAESVPVLWVEESGSVNSFYYGMYAADGNENTGWVSREGEGEGAWLKFYFGRPVTITEILVVSGEMEDLKGFGKLEAAELIFDDGSTSELVCKAADMEFWSQEIMPVTTSTVLLHVNSIYPGEKFDNLLIKELTFISNPNSTMAGITNDWNEKQTQGAQSKKDPAAESYIPKYWSWEPTGYDAQDYDGDNFVVGKWVSDDENTVLYVDFSSGPDYMEYGLWYKGREISSEAEIDWQKVDGEDRYESYNAYDNVENIHFEVTEEKTILMYIENETVKLKLKRAKYD